MSEGMSRKVFLGRAAAGGALLTAPGLFRAAAAGAATLPKTITFSNWPLYIDVKKKTHPSIDQFQAKYHVHVNYIEDINDNDSFFGKIEGPLSQGQSVGRDLIVMTDSSGLP